MNLGLKRHWFDATGRPHVARTNFIFISSHLEDGEEYDGGDDDDDVDDGDDDDDDDDNDDDDDDDADGNDDDDDEDDLDEDEDDSLGRSAELAAVHCRHLLSASFN